MSPLPETLTVKQVTEYLSRVDPDTLVYVMLYNLNGEDRDNYRPMKIEMPHTAWSGMCTFEVWDGEVDET